MSGLEAFAEALEPLELRSVREIPSDDGWLYEPKWDGFRAIVHREGSEVRITSRHGQPLARYFPEIVEALMRSSADRYSLDGELVVPFAGALSFDALQQRVHPAASRVVRLSKETPALFLAFDALRLDGDSLLQAPLRERRARLEAFAADAFESAGALRLSPATTELETVRGWFERVGGALDGVVAKRLDEPYVTKKRGAAVKIKRERTADCVVGGFRFPSGRRDRVASLLLGLYDREGRLDYVGFCSAFPEAERVGIFERLKPSIGGVAFTGEAPGETPSRWSRANDRDRSYVSLAPDHVIEVAFDQVTAGRIRHGTRFVRWRDDKPAARCSTEQLALPGGVLDLIGE